MATLTWDTAPGDNSITNGDGTWDTTTSNWTSDDGITNTTFTNRDTVIIGGSTNITIDGDVEVDVLDLTTRDASYSTISGDQITIHGVNDFTGLNGFQFRSDFVASETASLTLSSATFYGDFTAANSVMINAYSYASFHGDVESDFFLGTDANLYLNGDYSGSIMSYDGGGQVNIGHLATVTTSFFGINVSVSGVLFGTGDDAYVGAKAGSTFNLYDGIVVGNISFDNDADEFYGSGGNVLGKIDMGGGNDIFDMSGGSAAGFIEADKVVLGEGDDIMKVGSRIVEIDLINAGEGDDVVRINKAFADLEIKGADGDDKIVSGFGNDSVDGGADNDRLFLGLGDDIGKGGSGEDLIKGVWGDDTLYGGEGHDRVLGQKGDDEIYGGDDYDFLNGGSGSDTLFGGDGEDTLNGGRGQDILEGGLSDDTFFFFNAKHTKVGKADTITDFEQGRDRIDISSIDSSTMSIPLASGDGPEAMVLPDFDFNDSFVFGSVGDFSFGLGLISSEFVDGNTVLSGDIDNDGSIEFEIILEGEIELTASNFIGVTTIDEA